MTTAIDCLCAGPADAIATGSGAVSDGAMVRRQFAQLLSGAEVPGASHGLTDAGGVCRAR